MGKCESHDLAGEGRIGQGFLVARHRRDEADFADRMAFGAEADAPEDRAIRQDERAGRFACGIERRPRSWRRRITRLIGHAWKNLLDLGKTPAGRRAAEPLVPCKTSFS